MFVVRSFSASTTAGGPRSMITSGRLLVTAYSDSTGARTQCRVSLGGSDHRHLPRA
jgi:hypothetical protein